MSSWQRARPCRLGFTLAGVRLTLAAKLLRAEVRADPLSGIQARRRARPAERDMLAFPARAELRPYAPVAGGAGGRG